VRLQSGARGLELHALRSGEGTPLLLLHPLYSSSEEAWAEKGADYPALHWPGPVLALDFAGHGRSDWQRGGWYSSEHFVGDADLALAQIGRTAVLGAGVGAYVALLLAGARPDDVAAAMLLPGAGAFGGGAEPDFRESPDPWAAIPLGDAPARASAGGSHDPMLCCVEHEVRPLDYAREFANASGPLLLVEDGGERPPWWREARRSPRARTTSGDLATQLAEFSAAVQESAPGSAD
jgi:pimeloyl-ACP methyl ester carboxylesterase